LLVTAGGQALRFHEKQVRSMGRQAAGVTGIDLKGDDRVTSMDIVEPGGSLLVVTKNGFGKQTPLKEYPVRNRATGGIMTINQKALGEIGEVVSARVVQPNDEIALISSNGQTLRLKVSQISTSGRAARGVRLMGVGNGDSLASIARLPKESEPA
jgi:DNA gyrase subunit A